MERDGQGKSFQRVTVSLDREAYARLGELARKSELSTAWLIRKAIWEFLENNRSKDRII